MLAFPRFHLSVRQLANGLLFSGFLLIVLFISGAKTQTKEADTKVPTPSTQQFDSQVEGKCQKNQTYDCYVNALKAVYDQAGPQVSLDTLESLSTQDDFVKRDCHPYAHEMGRYAYLRIGNALKAFSYGSTICASGYLHGVMEGYLGQIRREHKDLQTEVINLCDAKENDTRFMQFQCLHGMGHGLTEYYGEDIMKSLPVCASLKTDWDKSSCYGGVFMENIVASTTPDHKSLYLKADQPEYPCNIVQADQKFSCYYLISSWFLQLTKYNYQAAFKLCDSVNPDFVSTCYQSMGRDISGSTLRSSSQSIADCKLGQGIYYNDCIIGVVKDFTNTTAKPDEAAVFCKMVSESSKAICYQAAGQVLADMFLNQKDFAKACSQLTIYEPSYKNSCLNS